MNIVFATDNYWPRISGMAVSIDSFKQGLERIGHEVHILAPDYPDAKKIDEEMGNENVHRFRSVEVFFSKEDRLVTPLSMRKVFKLLDTIKPDVIHIQTEVTLGAIVMLYAKKRGIPLVMTSHTYFEQYLDHYFPMVPLTISRRALRSSSKKFYSQANYIVTPTTGMRQVLRSYGIQKPIQEIPTGIKDCASTCSGCEEDKLNSKLFQEFPQLKGKQVLLYLGRIAREKNITFLLDMMKTLEKDHDKAILLIVGSGPFKNELQEIVKARGLSGQVVFTGFVDEDVKHEAYRYSDIFVFPSKTETQGLVTIEAMNHGTPVVAIGEMGTKDVMQGDNGGFMVEDDIEVFTQKVRFLLVDPELLVEKSMDAIEYSKKWTIDNSVKRMTNIYMNSILKTSKQPLNYGHLGHASDYRASMGS